MDTSVLHGIFWNHLVYPELASDEVEDPQIILSWIHDRLAAGYWPAYVVCLALDDLGDFPPTERREMIQSVRGLINRMLPPSQCALLGFAHTNAVYFCGSMPTGRESLLSQLTLLNQSLQYELGLSNTLGIAYVTQPDMHGLQWAAQYAIVAQRQKVQTGTNRVYVYSAEEPTTSIDLAQYLGLAQQMHMVVKSGDSTAMAHALDTVHHALFQQTYLPLHHIRPMLQCQVIFMAQAVIEAGVDGDATARQSEHYLAQLGNTFDYAELRGILTEAAQCFVQMVHQRYYNLTHRLVQAAEDYILAHLTDPQLSLQRLSKHLGASPTHISRTFKKAKGMALTRFINTQRVEMAKRHLLDQHIAVTELAFQLGFGSVQHFGRVFKELTGVSPTEYRHAKIA